jgi:uncharacterized protein (DUF2267 family)
MVPFETLRHHAHAATTYHAFIDEIGRLGQVASDTAEAAAVSVLAILEERIPIEEVLDLEAQLPSRLRDLLEARRVQEGWMLRRFDRPEFLHRIAEELGVSEKEAERLARVVFQALQERVSQGEIEDVAAGLPESLALLWRHPGNTYVPGAA